MSAHAAISRRSPFAGTVAGYPLPNVMANFEDRARFDQGDLRLLTSRELTLECLRVERALGSDRVRGVYVYVIGPPDFVAAEDWLYERLVAVKSEIARRAGDTRGRRSVLH